MSASLFTRSSSTATFSSSILIATCRSVPSRRRSQRSPNGVGATGQPHQPAKLPPLQSSSPRQRAVYSLLAGNLEPCQGESGEQYGAGHKEGESSAQHGALPTRRRCHQPRPRPQLGGWPLLRDGVNMLSMSPERPNKLVKEPQRGGSDDHERTDQHDPCGARAQQKYRSFARPHHELLPAHP